MRSGGVPCRAARCRPPPGCCALRAPHSYLRRPPECRQALELHLIARLPKQPFSRRYKGADYGTWARTRLPLSSPALRSSRRTFVGEPVSTDLRRSHGVTKRSSRPPFATASWLSTASRERGAHSLKLWFQTGVSVPRFALRVRSSMPPYSTCQLAQVVRLLPCREGGASH